jgi:RNA polymerase sigma-70 factor (ECF subfamily)
MDEQEAIARIKRGDPAGLEELVLRYQARAVHTAYLIVQDGAMAEDVAQNAFLQAYRKINLFDSQRAFGPWFLRSVVNAAIQAANRKKRSISLDVGEDSGNLQLIEQLADPHPCPEEIVQQAEARQLIQRTLEKLKPEQRAVVVLRYYLELSEAEMAEELQRPLSTVKWWLHSAIKRLRQMLRPLEEKKVEPVKLRPEEKEQKE